MHDCLSKAIFDTSHQLPSISYAFRLFISINHKLTLKILKLYIIPKIIPSSNTSHDNFSTKLSSQHSSESSHDSIDATS